MSRENPVSKRRGAVLLRPVFVAAVVTRLGTRAIAATVFLCWLLVPSTPLVAASSTPEQSYERRKRTAFEQANADAPEAEKSLKQLLKENKRDADVLFRLGRLLSDHARKFDPGSKRKKLLKEARQYYVQAQEAGSTEPLIATVLTAVHPDGTEEKAVFSRNADLDAAIKAGERAYEKRDFLIAVEHYQRAVAIEPRHYLATLYVGDAYFSAGNYPDAITWFKKAIELDPNNDMAYRYLGDAFQRQGKRDEALEQYIGAVIANPYSGYSWRSLQAGCRDMLIKPWVAAPTFPSAKVEPDNAGQPKITLSKNFSLWDTSYALARGKWQSEHLAKSDGKTASYRQTIAEEVDALRIMLTVWREGKSSGNHELDPKQRTPLELEPALNQLAEIDEAGLLEAHVLFFRANQDIAADYAAYRDANRDKLRTYLIRFYLHVR